MGNKENLYEIIADNIRKERKRLGITQMEHPERHIERFAHMMKRRNEREIEFALHMVEQLLRGQDSYLCE